MALQTQAIRAVFTVGICASDSASKLPQLVRFVSSEEYADPYCLGRIVIVASGCPREVAEEVEQLAESDERILLIQEPERRGKAEAISRILDNAQGELLVMVNSDAYPEPGAIDKLLRIASEPKVGIVSAEPVFEEGADVLGQSLGLMWSAHNMLSLTLNHAGVSNHASDELLVIRRNLLPCIPVNVVNDGAFMGGVVRARGYRVKFSTAARVKIHVPRLPIDLIRQRRRIIFGHLQVWKDLGNPPKTIESMMLASPDLSLRTLVKTVSSSPRMLRALPTLVVMESISVALGVFDSVRSTNRHRVWKRAAE